MGKKNKLVKVESLEEREQGVVHTFEEGAAVVMPPQFTEEQMAGADFKVVPNLQGQRLVLVGNGPSSPENASYIDRMDVVARIQGFPMGDAGTKWNIWPGCFGKAAKENIRKFGNHRSPNRPRVIWCAGDHRLGADDLGITRGSVVCLLPLRIRQRIYNAVGRPPTSGFMSIEMALRSEPRELVLVGFDATVPEEPGWDHWESEQGFPPVQTDKPNLGPGHSMAREKALIRHWLKTRVFCGRKFPNTRPRWWRMQEVGQLGDLAGKKVCLVGNGPSAPQYAEQIDACDVVVRCNAFCVGEAGHEWDAWWCVCAGIGGDYCRDHGLYDHPTRPGWLWSVPHLDKSIVPFKLTKFTGIHQERLTKIAELINRVSKLERGRHPVTKRLRPIQPTSGIFALDIALSLEPRELVLVGFDAYEFGKPGWKHFGSKPCAWHPEKPSISGGKHDYVAEKALIQKWFDTREFFESLYPHTKPTWWRLKK